VEVQDLASRSRRRHLGQAVCGALQPGGHDLLGFVGVAGGKCLDEIPVFGRSAMPISGAATCASRSDISNDPWKECTSASIAVLSVAAATRT
jgi:hypothetical protein